jgi:hypothetical protein
MGRLIGRRGCNIRRITSTVRAGCYIKGGGNIFTITAWTNRAVNEAKDMILEDQEYLRNPLSHSSKSHESFKVDNDLVKHIVGKQGAGIKTIMNKVGDGCYIVHKENQFHISGNCMGDVEHAIILLKKAEEDCRNNLATHKTELIEAAPKFQPKGVWGQQPVEQVEEKNIEEILEVFKKNVEVSLKRDKAIMAKKMEQLRVEKKTIEHRGITFTHEMNEAVKNFRRRTGDSTFYWGDDSAKEDYSTEKSEDNLVEQPTRMKQRDEYSNEEWVQKNTWKRNVGTKNNTNPFRTVRANYARGYVKKLNDNAKSSNAFIKGIYNSGRYNLDELLIAAVHVLSETSDEQTLQLLLGKVPVDKKIEMVNAPMGRNNYRPIHRALFTGNGNVLRCLLLQGADPSIRNDIGETEEEIIAEGLKAMMKRNPNNEIFYKENLNMCLKAIQDERRKIEREEERAKQPVKQAWVPACIKRAREEAETK